MALLEEAKKELEKMGRMKPGEALGYFWAYYKIHLFFLAIAFFFLILIAQAWFGAKQETVFSAMLINSSVTQEAADDFAEKYAASIQLDTETKQVVLDASVTNYGGTSQENVAGVQKTLVSVAAGEVDALLTDTTVADTLLKGGALSDLQAALPEATLSRFQDSLIYADAAALKAWSEANRAGNAEDINLISFDREGMENPVPIGVDVTRACEAAFQRPEELGSLVFCVCVTTQRQEETARFLTYLADMGGNEP